ncbi:MAG: hypothetical protein SVW57_01635 [Thermodesulfobacteriota bacterium]|nr:hypothetical protein [Thermodesulfobacteriota bacterium]
MTNRGTTEKAIHVVITVQFVQGFEYGLQGYGAAGYDGHNVKSLLRYALAYLSLRVRLVVGQYMIWHVRGIFGLSQKL